MFIKPMDSRKKKNVWNYVMVFLDLYSFHRVIEVICHHHMFDLAMYSYPIRS